MHRPGNDVPTVSIVVPMYNEGENVVEFVRQLTEMMATLGESSELILVDDGSQDDTWERISAAVQDHANVRGISFSRNFGHQNGLLCGMQWAAGECIVTMDGDLQHPPSLVPELIRRWRAGAKVVNTRREYPEDIGVLKRLTSYGFYRVFSWLSGIPLNPGSSDFRLLDRQVFNAISDIRDTDLFLRGVVQWAGFPVDTVTFRAGKRYSGTTKFSFGKMLRVASTAVLSFSLVPLRLGLTLGFLTALFAVAEVVYVIVVYLQDRTVPGWASVTVLVAFLFAILFVVLGIIGAYLGSVFEILKNRPRFIVHRQAGFPAEGQRFPSDPSP